MPVLGGVGCLIAMNKGLEGVLDLPSKTKSKFFFGFLGARRQGRDSCLCIMVALKMLLVGVWCTTELLWVEGITELAGRHCK